jgi:hypothetical protein
MMVAESSEETLVNKKAPFGGAFFIRADLQPIASYSQKCYDTGGSPMYIFISEKYDGNQKFL